MASNYGMNLQARVNLCAGANAPPNSLTSASTPPNLQPCTNPQKNRSICEGCCHGDGKT